MRGCEDGCVRIVFVRTVRFVMLCRADPEFEWCVCFGLCRVYSHVIVGIALCVIIVHCVEVNGNVLCRFTCHYTSQAIYW